MFNVADVLHRSYDCASKVVGGSNMKDKEEAAVCNINAEEIRKSTKVLLESLNKRFKRPEDFLTKEFIETIREIDKAILPNVPFERNWNDHIHFITVLVRETNKQCKFCKAEIERLGRMGVVLKTNAIDDQLITDYSCGERYHPFAIFLAANVKYLFRDLSITIKPTRYLKTRALTEILMQ